MGGTLKTVSNWFCRNGPVFRVVLIGEYGAGKTAALYKMYLGELVTSLPTVGFNMERMQFKNGLFELWDMGGSTYARRLWHHYFQDAAGVVFFIDLSRTDEDYWRDSRELLEKTMEYKGVKEMPWLMVCNKQDIAKVSVEDAVGRHDIQKYSNVVMKVISACAITGAGVKEGF